MLFIGSTAVSSMKASITASCATAARDTHVRSDRWRLIASSPYRLSGASATTRNKPGSTSSSRSRPVPGSPDSRRGSRGTLRDATTQYT
jgi:hypothetical protein